MTLDEQLAYLTKGCVDVVRLAELKSKLERAADTRRPLTVKVGFDPTAPDLHLGHTVLLRKMKHFQDLGHRVIFVIGDFTGMIGDPSGRSKTRPPLSPEDIARNADTYRSQVFKVLHPERTVVDFNSRWLGAFASDGWIRLASRYNVAQMFERRDFRQRYETGQPIALHEFLYPLAQAYDSVALEADVELGGTDQLFNLNVGRDIMPSYGLEPQIVMTVPLLVGLDGVEKMSKSLGNYVGVNEPPTDMMRKLVEDFRGTDEVLWTYFTLLTDLMPAEIDDRRRRMEAGEVSPSEVRYELGRLIVGSLHGTAAALEAEEAVRARHRARASGGIEGGADLPATQVVAGPDGAIGLPQVIAHLRFAPSASEASRQVKGGGVKIDGERVTDLRWTPPQRPGTYLLAVGARKLARLHVE